jgi:signal transduction histidine kinase/ligand-binding sensor domain-containing protein
MAFLRLHSAPSRLSGQINIRQPVLLLLLLIFVLVHLGVLSAQPDKLRFERLSQNDGLPNSSVYTLLQDKQGFVWIGTFNGLARYDGQRNTIFRTIEGDSTSLPFNFVQALYEDADGILWIGTTNGGLCSFDRITERFHRYPDLEQKSLTRSNDDVVAITEDNAKRLWIGTRSGGVKIFDRATHLYTDIFLANKGENLGTASRKKSPYRIHTDCGLLSDNILTLYKGKFSARLWVATRNGLHYFDEPSHRFVALPLLFDYLIEPNRANAKELSSYGTTLYNAYTLCEDRFGTLWMGSDAGMLYALPKGAARFSAYRYDPERIGNTSQAAVKAIYEDSRGTLWIGTSDGGLKIFDRFADRSPSALQRLATYSGTSVSLPGTPAKAASIGMFTASYTSVPFIPKTLGGNGVYCLMEDRSGVLWVGSARNGISKADLKQSRFVLYEHEPLNTNCLTQNNVRSVLEDRTGRVWIGTSDSGVHCFDLKRRFMSRYACPQSYLQSTLLDKKSSVLPLPSKPLLTQPFLQGNTIRTITEDSLGNMWFGTQIDGIAKLATYHSSTDRKSNKSNVLTTYLADSIMPYRLSSPGIRAALCDRSGRLWIGTKLGGIARCVPEASPTYPRFDVFQYPRNGNSIELNDVFAVHEDRAGQMWVGTNKGLFLFNPATALHEFYCAPTTSVVCIHEDTQGVLWMGTIGRGLCAVKRSAFSQQQQKPAASKPLVRSFGIEEGLPSTTVYGITEDMHGRLWLSTNNGLVAARVHRERLWDTVVAGKSPSLLPPRRVLETYVYREEDGIQGDEFSQGAYCRGKSGWMYFGGIGGVTAFHPDSVHPNPVQPPVVLTGFKKLNHYETLDTSIGQKKLLYLRHSDQMITFEFAALDFSNPRKNRYKYKLEGFDDNWIDAGTRHEATYTNLDGGSYTFHVIACNNDGVWNDQGAVLAVYVEPPVWKTLWFTLLSVLMLIVSGFVTYRFRVQQLQQRTHRLEELVYERTVQIQQNLMELEQANEQIVSQVKELTLLNNEKTELMGIVAHDLKNPLGAIRSFGELIREGWISAHEVPSVAGRVVETADRMITLVRNLLDINRAEQGLLELRCVAIDISTIVEGTVWQYSEPAKTKNIILHYQNSQTTSLSNVKAFADEQAIVQVMDNIISNAVKYSPLGKQVFVRVTNTETAVRVEVQDEGPGLTDDDKAKLFGKFTRLSAQPTGGEHSTGLGLSIVKRLVEAMGGRVWCESEVAKGATFVVELPAAAT